MSLFEPVTLTWKGEDFNVEPEKVMKLIAVIEEHISFYKLTNGEPPATSIAFAYGAALRYAGAKVTDEEVYVSLFGGEGAGVSYAVSSLMMMMVPPSVIAEQEQDKTPKKKAAPRKKAPRKKAKS